MVDRVATVCVDSAGQGAVDATSSHAVIIIIIIVVVIIVVDIISQRQGFGEEGLPMIFLSLKSVVNLTLM